MRRSNVTFLAPSLTAVILVGLAAVWTALQWRGTQAISDLDELVAACLGAIACAGAAYRHRGRARAAWTLMGASALAWGAGEAVWSWYELHAGVQVPFPSLADAGFLAAVPLAVVGALLFPGQRRSARTRLASALDGLIIACGLLAVSWVAVLHSVFTAGADSTFAEVLGLAYPAGDVLIATILTALLIRLPGRNRLPLVLVVAGLAANAVADSSFAYLTAHGTYASGSVFDVGWFAGYLLLALGALRAAQRPAATESEGTWTSWWRLVVPYVPMAAMVTVAARQVVVDQTLEPFVFWLLFALVVLVVGRQFLTLSDNHALLRHLGSREAEMRHRAYHDPLTDLANRSLFRRRLEVALHPRGDSERYWVAVMVVDLDDFKYVNDTLGHEAGDRLLMEVGARLLDNMRPADTVARLGGDEFAILLETVGDVQQAERVAARVVAALDRAAHLGGYALPVRASLGLALSHCGEVSSEELMRQADVAMYRAKGEGKGRWVIYDRSMESDSGLAAIHGGLLDSRVG